jgi:hypothetical protein
MKHAWLALLAACGGGGTKHMPDAAARCSPTAPFGAGVALSSLNTAADELAARLSPDELVVVFASGTSAANYDLYTATRANTSLPFTGPTLIGSLNSVYSDSWPTLTPDQLVVAFESTRPAGAVHIFSSQRTAPTAPFSPPAAELALSDGEGHPMIASAAALYFSSAVRPGAGMHDLWRSQLDATGKASGPITVPGMVNTADDEDAPVVSPDELEIIFLRTTARGASVMDATRAANADPFGAPTEITGLVAAGGTAVPDWISPDGCALYFHGSAPGGAGGQDLYVATRGP